MQKDIYVNLTRADLHSIQVSGGRQLVLTSEFKKTKETNPLPNTEVPLEGYFCPAGRSCWGKNKQCLNRSYELH